MYHTYRIKTDLQVCGRLQIAQTMVTAISDGDIQIATVMEDGSMKTYSIKAMQDEIDCLKKQMAELILLGQVK